MPMTQRLKQLTKIKPKLTSSLGVIIVAAILLELISAVQYYYTRGLLEQELEHRAESELMAKMNLINNTLNSTEQTLQEHMWDIRQNLKNADSMMNVTRRMIESNQNIIGGCIAFVPYYYKEKGELYEPYAYRSGDKILTEQIANKNHDYTKNPSFLQAWHENSDLWSDPYEYKSDSIIYLSTYSHPLTDDQGKVVGVLGLDLSLDWLADTLNTRHIFPSSFNMILTQKGDLIAGYDSRHDTRDDVKGIVKLINDSTTKKKTSRSGRSKVVLFTDGRDDSKAYVFYTSQKDKPYWQVAVTCYDDEVYGKLYQMRFWILLMMLAGLLVLGFILHRFAKGEKQLRAADLEKERMGSELHVASNIQKSMMEEGWNKNSNSVLSPDISTRGFQVPAKEVGGDLYCYFVRDEKLFYCIGDVSGKGIPAALVMAVTHSMFRACSTHESNPARIISTINVALCQNNNTNMFVTLFIGVLDLPTGRMRYCNAGHDCPIMIEHEVKKLSAKPNLPVGIFDDVEYRSQEVTLQPGTSVFLYTDGLTEARNTKRELLGLPRVMERLEQCCKQNLTTPDELLHEMKAEVDSFADGAEQSDDLTMLALRYEPEEKGECVLHEELHLKNQMSEVPQLGEFVKMVGERLGLNSSLIIKMRLALEEVVVNVINYAYPEEAIGDIEVVAEASTDRLKFVVIDSGSAFAPTDVPKADISQPVEERRIGGMGILLVRQLMDSVNYERIDGKNILTMRKNLSPSNPSNPASTVKKV